MPSIFYSMPYPSTLSPWGLLWKYWDSFLTIFFTDKVFGNTSQILTHENPSSTWQMRQKRSGYPPIKKAHPPQATTLFDRPSGSKSLDPLFFSYCVSIIILVAQPCLTLCHPMDCSLPGSSVHRILQERILEWVAISFSRGSSWPRDQTWISCIEGRFLTFWTTREACVSTGLLFFSNGLMCGPQGKRDCCCPWAVIFEPANSQKMFLSLVQSSSSGDCIRFGAKILIEIQWFCLEHPPATWILVPWTCDIMQLSEESGILSPSQSQLIMANNSSFTTTSRTNVYQAPTLCNAQWHEAGSAHRCNNENKRLPFIQILFCARRWAPCLWLLSYPILPQTLWPRVI